MQIVKTSLVFAVMLMATACTQAPMQPAQVSQARLIPVESRGVVNVQVGGGFKALAARKTRQDIDHFHLQLINQNGQITVEDDIRGQAGKFVEVPDGEYHLVADALDANDQSLVEGGGQTSVNTVTIADGVTTYSDDSGVLYVTLSLLNGTPDTGSIRNAIEIIDGQPAESEPALVPVGGAS